MNAEVLWITAFLAFPLAGAVFIFHDAYRPYGFAARIALAGAVGAVAVSLAMNFASLVGWRWNLPELTAAGFLECWALRWTVGASPGDPSLNRVPFSRTEWIAVGVCAVSALAAGAAALSASATSPDLLLFWGTKARAFAAARAIDADFLGQPLLRFLHVSYPPLVTSVYAFATMAAGALPWRAAVGTFPLLVATIAAGLPGILRRAVPRADAWVATAAITASIGLLGDALDVAGNADVALLLFETFAIAILMGPDGDRPAGQILGGVLLAGAVSTKVEGLPFAVAAAAFFLLLRPASGPVTRLAAATLHARLAAATRLLLPSGAALGAWFAFGRQRHLFNGYETYGATFDVHLARAGLIAQALGRAFFRTGAALPWLVPLAALGAVRHGYRRAVYPLAVAGALIAFFFFTYLHGALDPTAWIGWSAGRIFAVVSVLLILAVTSARAGARETEEGGLTRGATSG